jgi:1-aminocyclopropane-1-carboxylate deaminase/D-cysteine desulfhydrase-like pyridoxal-dependent ACC family enzyme
VYTAKMLQRTLQMIKQDLIKPGSTLLALHTGGLQGKRSVYGSKN